MHIVLLGPPGGGKGTQAEHLQQRLGLVHIASGDLFRDHLHHQTALGLEARDYMGRGELVPDSVTIGMVSERLHRPDVRAGTLFDGFPRTVEQAEALDGMLADLGMALSGVICIEVPDEELVGRIAGRLVCRECEAPFHVTAKPFATCPHHRCSGEHLYRREDDNEETVRRRLATYHARTEPLIEFYDHRGLLVCVPGSGSVDDVSRAVMRSVERLKTPHVRRNAK
jgi:adenylate kinase